MRIRSTFRRYSSYASAALLLAGLSLGSVAHAAEPPSTGAILQQNAPAPMAPSVPGAVLSIPAPNSGALRSSVKLTVHRLHITGNTLLPAAELTRLTAALKGKTVTLGDLQALATRLTDLYQAAGYPLAYAYLPAQTVHGGMVEIAVIEPHYDRIELKGQTRLKKSMARRTLGVRSGQMIAEGPLARGLLLLERTPGVRVAGTFVPGARLATSSLNVHLANEPRVRASLGADNYGSTYTGRGRARANVSVADPFGYGSQIAVNGLSTESGLLHAGGFALLSPNLWNGLRVGLNGSRTNYRLGGVFANLGQSGTADQYGLSVSYPLILRPGRLLQTRFDLQRVKLAQTTASVGSQNNERINLATFSLSGVYADHRGGLYTAEMSIARGQLDLGAGASNTAGTAGRFWVGRLNLGRSQPLVRNWRLHVGLSGQFASKNLDASQQFYLGGPNGVMSYPVGEASGGEGVLLRIRLIHSLKLPARIPGRLDLSLLAQAGKVWVYRDRFPGTGSNNELSRAGYGLGVDYAWTQRLNASLSYIRQLGPAQATAGPDHQGELWASLTVNF